MRKRVFATFLVALTCPSAECLGTAKDLIRTGSSGRGKFAPQGRGCGSERLPLRPSALPRGVRPSRCDYERKQHLGGTALNALPLDAAQTIARVLLPGSFELEIFARLLLAAAMGTAIGWERRSSHRPAGVRTMSLVALGAACFAIVSAYGFARGDPSRVAANICSGVGFLGAGVITSDASKRTDRRGGDAVKQDYESEVRGLTTAASIWITAGLGMCAGTGLYFTAISGSIMTVCVLEMNRFRKIAKSALSTGAGSWEGFLKSFKRKKGVNKSEAVLDLEGDVTASTSSLSSSPSSSAASPVPAAHDKANGASAKEFQYQSGSGLVHPQTSGTKPSTPALGAQQQRRAWTQNGYFTYLNEATPIPPLTIKKRADWELDRKSWDEDIDDAVRPPARNKITPQVRQEEVDYIDIDAILDPSKRGESLDY